MPFSAYLDNARKDARELVSELDGFFDYVSVLGSDVRETAYRADKRISAVQDTGGECGFVIKINKGKAFFEYSVDDISGDKKALAATIVSEFETAEKLNALTISSAAVKDEPMKKDFLRETDFSAHGDEELLDFCKQTAKKLADADEKVLNGIAMIRTLSVSKLFVTKHRELTQHYGWANGFLIDVYNDDKLVQARKIFGEGNISDVMEKMRGGVDKVLELARHLVKAKPVEPGVYDVITHPSVTGLIAHEAFGHGVEMDQFVKDRALAKNYVGKYVASPITNMHDGAAAAYSVASYFFDDDGVLAHDTQIIKDGVLVAGLCDLTAATELGVEPTGNGRRESFKRKAYSRMTNTFFTAGKDKVEDMIRSIKHGYMLFDTNNGMEDPKNWQIQCTAEYGVEIVDGKLTDNYVSPVVMSGYVPDLLKSITMVSDEFEVIGAGMCGKGHKEWVRVSDGGPHLKVRVKLG